MSRPQLFSGARGVLKIDSRPIAYVTDVSVTINSNVRAVHTFGAVNARSVEPLSVGATVSIGRVFPINDVNGNAVNTSDVAIGIEPIISQLVSADDITVTLIDRTTDQTVANVQNCRFAGRTLNVAAQNVANERIQLVGIYDAAGGNVRDGGPGL